ncbi:hypothetical protein ACTPL8_002823 [Enterococcus faecium]
MKKFSIPLLSVILCLAITNISQVFPKNFENIVYADADSNRVQALKNAIRIYFESANKYIYMNDQQLTTNMSSAEGFLESAKWIKNDGTIFEADLTKLDENNYHRWDSQIVPLSGDVVELTFLQNGTMENLAPYSGVMNFEAGKTYMFKINEDGSVTGFQKDQGQGQVQVTYNVNTITPDDPTSNPDYAVLIPTQYELSDKSPVSKGSIAMKNIDDLSQNYAGEQSIKVSISSAKNYHFDNEGTYKLVGENDAAIPAEITLNKTTPSSKVDAHLVHKGHKTPSSDVLTFTYTTAVTKK